jgi:hypothetical protein
MWEIHAPGDAWAKARAAASSSKLQSDGRYSPRLMCEMSARLNLLAETPELLADSKVNGAAASVLGRSIRDFIPAL